MDFIDILQKMTIVLTEKGEAMSKLIFYEADHSYEVDGVKLPSVSEILRFMSREIYSNATQFQLDHAADRGTRVHRACENIDRYGSCEADNEIEPYVMAYIQFLKDKKPKWSLIETSMCDLDWGYAGTIDRYGVIDARRVIVDIKTNSSLKIPLVTAQLNGYKNLAEKDEHQVDAVASLHLKKDGTYSYKERPKDDVTFEACLLLHKALKPKGEYNGTN